MEKKIKLIIAEKSELMREGIKSYLNEYLSFELVDDVGNGRQVIALLKRFHVDIVLMGVDMPKMNGMETLDKIMRYYRDTKVIMLNVSNEPELQLEYINAGALSYLPKNFTKEELIEVLLAVYQNGLFVKDEKILLLKNGSKPGRQKMISTSITDRELDVLKELFVGKTEKEIATKLGIKQNTVHTHINSLLRKTGTHKVSMLLKYASEQDFF